MKKTINRVGLSWSYDYIKFDLINCYNQLKNIEELSENNIDNIDINIFKAVDIKLAHLTKVFYLLNIPAGVFFVNEFRLSLNFILHNLEHFKYDTFSEKLDIIINNIESIMDYINDIIQGYGDLLIYYVTVVDELRLLREDVLFSQSSYIINSVKQQNISEYTTGFDQEKRDRISKALANLYNSNTDQGTHENLIKHINILKIEFQGTQHCFLWEIIAALSNIDKNYSNSSCKLEKKVIKQIITNYNNVFDTINFDKMSKVVPAWIGTLCFCLIYNNSFNLLDKNIIDKIYNILTFHANKSISNHMAFVEQMQETDSWILILDISSELNIAIEKLNETKHKQRLDINWLIELLQKHIDSCILTGTYDVLESYYNILAKINEYTVTGGFISGDDLETVVDFTADLIEDIENNIDNNKQGKVSNQIIQFEEESNNTPELKVLKQQIIELDNILKQLNSVIDLKFGVLLDNLKNVLNIFQFVNFKVGIKAVTLYLDKIKNMDNTACINSSIKDNINVFIKYLIEITKALSLKKSYISYVHLINELINDIDFIHIDSINSKQNIKLDTGEDSNFSASGDTCNKKTVDHSNIISIFFEEADGLLEKVHASLDILNKSVDSVDSVGNVELDDILGCLHTLKGSARMIGFIAFGDLVHYTESLFKQCQVNLDKLDKNIINILEDFINRISTAIISYDKDFRSNSKFIHNIDNLTLEYQEVDLEFNNHSKHKPVKNKDNLSMASVLLDKPETQEVAASNLQNSLLQLRQSMRVNKVDYDDLLDSSTSLVLNQQQLLRSNENHKKIVNKLKSIYKDNSNSEYKTLELLINKIEENYTINTNLIAVYNNNITAIFDKLFKIRSVPLAAIKSRLGFLVQSVSDDLGKSVSFNLQRADGVVDSFILESVAPCLDHIVRNAICHGIEDENIRLEQNKSSIGVIGLEIYNEKELLNIVISDDGRGLDQEVIINKADEQGVLEKLGIDKSNISDDNLFDIIAHHGFTTKDTLTHASGRGIGLNYVKKVINKLSGVISFSTSLNKGTSFIIKIPSSLSKQKLQFIKLCDLTYGIPDMMINMVAVVSGSELKLDAQSDKIYYLDSEVYVLYNLLNLDEIIIENSDKKYNNHKQIDKTKTYQIIFVKYKDKKYSFMVDEVLAVGEAVVRPFGHGLSSSVNELLETSGVTVSQKGDIVLVLDIINILNKVSNTNNDDNNSRCGNIQDDSNNDKNLRASEIKNTDEVNILAVEDSATLRHVIGQYLTSKQDYRLTMAVDGLDALEKVRANTPDLVILDISMPRMNGLEFLKVIRKEENYKDLPVIITTSREEEVFKEVAMQLNVDVYLKKPYDQNKLLNAIEYVLG